MELVIVRHARPEVIHGDGTTLADPGLTDEGRAQAAALAAWLAEGDRGVGAIYSSPMRRARETAQALADTLGLPVREEDRLAEFDRGGTAYVPVELLGRQRLVEVSRALETGAWGEHRFEPEVFRRTVADAFAAVVAERRAERVAVVCHGGVINSYLCDLLAMPYGIFVAPDYTSLTRVRVDAETGECYLHSINETPHLS